MRPLRKSRALRAVAVVGALLMSGWGVDAADARPAAPEAPAAAATPERAAQAAPRTVTVRYGPYTIQPAPENPDGTHGHAHSGNQFALNVEKPCTDCFITEMKPDLVKADGTRAGFSNNLQLHHMVLFNQDTGRTDATCPSSLGLLGQRFFASGDERTVINYPEGYGYRVGGGSRWNLIWDLASMSGSAETVYYTVQFTYVPASTAGMRDVEPVWLDVDQCGDSQVDIPVGPSTQTWTWNVNRPGQLLSVGGHLHDSGIDLEVRNQTTGQVICNSVAGYGETPLYVDHHGNEHISSMSTCGGPGRPPVTTLQTGQQVRITSRYDSPVATNDAMGIAVAYMARDGGGGGTGCVTATNAAHVQAGRATSFLFFAWAVGSDEFLGLTSATTSLREAEGRWTRVASC